MTTSTVRTHLFLSTIALVLACSTLAAQQSVITGMLVGHDGRPMRAAHVHLAVGAPNEETRYTNSVEVAANGAYRLVTDATGIVQIRFTGVDHAPYDLTTIIAKPGTIQLDVTLGTRMISPPFNDVRVIPASAEFSYEGGTPLKRAANGTYRATIATDQSRFAYQLLFTTMVQGQTSLVAVNGTEGVEFQYDGAGDYRSVIVPAKGRATVVFDPRKLPPAGRQPAIVYHDSLTRRLAEMVHAVAERRDRMFAEYRAAVRAGTAGEDFRVDWSADAARLAAMSTSERDPLLRQAALVSYAALGLQGAKGLDSTIMLRVLTEVPATSPLWSIAPGAAGSAVENSGNTTAHNEYMWDLLQHHADTTVRVTELIGALAMADIRHQADWGRRLYGYMMEAFADRPEARYAKTEFNPDRVIQEGRPIPDFSFPSLDSPNTTISKAGMMGRVYLIDFWATWCGPCVAELPNLHKAYERFAGPNFEIVSVSFDRAVSDIAPFRANKFKMPWLHAFADGNFASDLAARFEVVGIPKPILVSADGTIIATENKLRGTQLERTLESVLSPSGTR